MAENVVHEISHESSAVVGIPVLADIDEPIPPPTAINAENRLDLPTISVTKAPAPLPVALPTPRDILSESSPNSNHSSFDEDLESGRSAGMREVEREQPKLVSTSLRQQNPQLPTSYEDADSGESALAISSLSTAQSRSNSPSGTGRSTTLKADIPDFLADSAPVMDTQPISPSSPVSELVTISTSEPVVDADQVPDLAPQLDDADEHFDPNTTIRLVGGGGVSGIVSGIETEEPQSNDVEKDNDAASIASATSESVPKGGKTHKKTKSGLAGLKKLGNLGGLRKKDSNSSLKGTVTPPTAA